MVKSRVKRRRRLNIKHFLKFILVISLIILAISYFWQLKIKHIKINGTTNIEDIEVIKVASIEDYPAIFHINTKDIIKKIKTIPLVKNVTIERNIFGKLTINIEEDKILFYDKSKDKMITSSNRELDVSDKYIGYATLVNRVTSDIYEKLILGLDKVDLDVLRIISEIEYSPSQSVSGEIIDEERFKLLMNDGNTVYINPLNILNLNKYIEFCSAQIASTDINTKGTFYLDSATNNNVFEIYGKEDKGGEEKSE